VERVTVLEATVAEATVVEVAEAKAG